MMSTLVLVRDAPRPSDEDRAREIVVRSLGWLVSAVMAGLIGDVVLAASSGLDLGETAESVGCRRIEANEEGERLRQGVAACRKSRLLVLRSGFAADAAMVDALDTFLRGDLKVALIQAMPESPLQTLMPRLAPVVGVVLPRDDALMAQDFDDLVRSRRSAPRLRSRLVPLT